MADHRFYEDEVQMLACLLRRSLVLLLLGSSGITLQAQNISPLAAAPRWKNLEPFQETITRADFLDRLENVYATRGYDDLIKVGENSAQIIKNRGEQETFTLRFAGQKPRPLPSVFWRRIENVRGRSVSQPLRNLHIALDPGHLGGAWARMEERWFQMDETAPVKEGEMTLRVAQLLAPKLRDLGADVTFVRRRLAPVTPKRPDDFRELARAVLAKSGTSDPPESYQGTDDPQKEKSVRWQSELLFYRQSEIRYRARRVNRFLQPDLVLCLHFNAEAWGNPQSPTLIERNHFHVLVNGSYLSDELEHDDERYEMLQRLLSRVYEEELPVAQTMAGTVAKETGLPPYEYTTDNVRKLGPYVYARNLLATRVFRCPVIYFEPYVMNSHEVFARVQAGDYEGTREFGGAQRPSIYREYAQAVADGLAEYSRESLARRR